MDKMISKATGKWYSLVIAIAIISLCAVIGLGWRMFEHSIWNRTNRMNENGARLLKEEKYAEAIEVYTEVLALDSDNMEAEEGLSDAYVELARTSENESLEVAIEDYQKAINYDENNLIAYRELAELYFQQHNIERAFGMLDTLNYRYSQMCTSEYLSNTLFR